MKTLVRWFTGLLMTTLLIPILVVLQILGLAIIGPLELLVRGSLWSRDVEPSDPEWICIQPSTAIRDVLIIAWGKPRS